MLEAIKFVGAMKGKSHWLVRCDCGVEKTLPGTELTKGKIKSCGCNLKAGISAANKKHGMSKHPAYWVWRSMRDRCNLPTHQAYINYGARGISVCDVWNKGFQYFWNDMHEGYKPGLTLDRVDNEKGYYKENCRWTTCKIQSNNRRNNILIDTPLGQMTCSEASEKFGVGKTTIAYRIAAGWPMDALLIAPDFRNRNEK